MRFIKYLLVIGALMTLSACGNNASGNGVISLNGGGGGTSNGGDGGSITTGAVKGDVHFNVGGTVDASFTVPGLAQNFGTNHAIINGNTIVGTTTTPNSYYVATVDHTLHFVNSSGTDTGIITGLTVNSGATLHFPNEPVVISGAIVINGSGTVTSDGNNLDLKSNSLLQINGGGRVTTTPATGNSGLLILTSDGILINEGTIDSSGVADGTSGGVILHVGTFLYSTGNVFAKGSGTGNGGPIQLLSDTASVYSSGTIDASGGSGTTGGNSGNITLSGGGIGIGRVVVQGTVTGNGGIGSAGNGGTGGTVSLTSMSGGILVNATINASGGQGSTNGGTGGSLQLANSVGSAVATNHQLSPEGIKVNGNITLNGGQGGAQGGNGGTLTLDCDAAVTALPGYAAVQFFGYQTFNLNGAKSTASNGGKGGIVMAKLTAPLNVAGVNFPPGGIVNQVAINARGGDGAASQGSGATGGIGGFLVFKTPENPAVDSGDPVRTVVTNSGSIDVTGGAGDIGGAAGDIAMDSYANLGNTGSLYAVGGKGTTSGGKGGGVALASTGNLNNSSSISGGGGNGITGGNGGTISLAAGNQSFNTSALSVNGGNSTASGNGGNGGIISFSSELGFFYNTGGSMNVAKGSGGSANTAINGTILQGNVNVSP